MFISPLPYHFLYVDWLATFDTKCQRMNRKDENLTKKQEILLEKRREDCSLRDNKAMQSCLGRILTFVWEVKMWGMKWRKNQSRKIFNERNEREEERKENDESRKIMLHPHFFPLHTYNLQFKLESEPTSFLPWLLANNLRLWLCRMDIDGKQDIQIIPKITPYIAQSPPKLPKIIEIIFFENYILVDLSRQTNKRI